MSDTKRHELEEENQSLRDCLNDLKERIEDLLDSEDEDETTDDDEEL